MYRVVRREQQDLAVRRVPVQHQRQLQNEASSATQASGHASPSHATSLLAQRLMRGRGNSSATADVILGMQQAYGNRAVQRVLQRRAVAHTQLTESTPAQPQTVVAVQMQPAPTGTNVQEGVETPEAPTATNPLVGLKKGDGLNYGTFDKRPRVKQLQERLRVNGSTMIDLDGMFGKETAESLRRFQELFQLPQKEVVDEATANKLMENTEGPTTATEKKSGLIGIDAMGMNGKQANGSKIKIVDGFGAMLGDLEVSKLQGAENTEQRKISILVQFMDFSGQTKTGQKIRISSAVGLLSGHGRVTPMPGTDKNDLFIRLDFIHLTGKRGDGKPITIQDARGFLIGWIAFSGQNPSPQQAQQGANPQGGGGTPSPPAGMENPGP